MQWEGDKWAPSRTKFLSSWKELISAPVFDFLPSDWQQKLHIPSICKKSVKICLKSTNDLLPSFLQMVPPTGEWMQPGSNQSCLLYKYTSTEQRLISQSCCLSHAWHTNRDPVSPFFYPYFPFFFFFFTCHPPKPWSSAKSRWKQLVQKKQGDGRGVVTDKKYVTAGGTGALQKYPSSSCT